MSALTADVRRYFEAPNISHVATVLPDGSPHSVPNSMALVRGHIVEVLDGDKAWTIIDRMSHKYLGQPYPLRTDRVLFLVEVDHAWAQGY